MTKKTITRAHVHKSAKSEALVESLRPGGGKKSWIVSASVPRGHRENGNRPNLIPTILGVELVRQAGMAVCSVGYSLPKATAFTIERLEFVWEDERPEYPRFDAMHFDISVTTSEHVYRKGELFSLALHYEFLHAGTVVATSTVAAKCLAAKDYALFRRSAPAAGEAPVRHDDTAWTIADMWPDGIAEGVLGWDESDPFVFDHAVDHVPGMQFVRAAITLHQKAGFGVEPQSVELTFHRFAELTEPVHISARFRGRRCDVTFLQGQREVVSATTS